MEHVKTVISFNLENEDEVFEAFNWRNCRPVTKRKLF